MVAIAGFVVGASPAWADAGTPGWYLRGDINNGGTPRLAVDAAGDDFVAYSLQDPLTGFTGYAIWVAQRTAGPGTDLAAPVLVSATGADDNSLYPSIASDAAGDVVVAWVDDGLIYAATKPAAASTFSDPVLVSNPKRLAEVSLGNQVNVAMDSAGDAVVVWPEYSNGTDSTDGDILVGAMRPVGASFNAASFSAPQQIYDARDDTNKVVTVTSVAMGGGKAVIAYIASAIPRASTWAADGAGPSGGANLGQTDCPGADSLILCTNPTVAVDSQGRAIAAFLSTNEIPDDPNVGVNTVLVATETAGTWSGPTGVAAGPVGSGPVRPIAVATSPNGHTAVAWNQTTGTSNTDVTDEVAVGSFSAGIGTSLPLDQPTSYLQTVGVDDQGTLLTTWIGSLSSTTLESSVLPAGTTTWQDPAEFGLPSAQDTPVQHTAADGDTVVAYASPVSNGVGGSAVALYGFDAAGASVKLTVPATAVPGHAVPMSAAVDDYATVTDADVSWHFGDGDSASGFTASHKYADPGSYSVTVTVTDAAGFAVTKHKQLVVALRTLTAGHPTISGTPHVGHTLTAHPGTWTSGTSFAYRWYADGNRITGATHKTLTLTHHQKGKKIKVEVTGTKSGYRTVTKSSSVTNPVTG